MRMHIFFPGYNFTFYILTSWRLHISTSKLQFLIFEELQVTYLDFKVTSYNFFMKSYDFFQPLGGVPVPLNGYFDTPAIKHY